MQLALPFTNNKSRRGGRRAGAGRKPTGKEAGQSHLRRPRLAPYHPAHVTVRMRDHVYNLRSGRCFRVIRRAFEKGRERLGVRLIEFSVHGNHIHLLVEATDERALGRGMKGLGVRIAKGLNRVMNRRGAVLSDRYDARILRTPAEVRNVKQYILDNFARHSAKWGRPLPPTFRDSFSSAIPENAQTLIVPPRVWLLTVGWQKVKARAAPTHAPP